MAVPKLQEALIMGGNSPTEKAILSIMEAQIRGVLTNEKTSFFMRTTITPYQISNLPGVGMALYRAVVRLVWGSTWDDTTGTKKQVTSVKTTSVILDQFLTIDWKITEIDIERFITSNPDVAATMASSWVSSMTDNLLYNLELTLLQGIKDYCIAKSLVLPINLLSLTPEAAVETFYQIGKRNNKQLVKKVDNITVGLNKGEITGVFGIDGTLEMTKAYQRLNYSQIAADTITTGKLYKTSVIGVETYESFFLEQDFDHTNETKMHLEKDYILNDFLGAYTSNYMWGMAISFEKIRQILDQNTGNMKWLGKCLYAAPTAVRPDLCYIIRSTMPTVAEINTARAKDWNTVADKSTASFKKTDYDDFILDLNNVIYFLDLGKITMAGATPTSGELDTAVINAGNVGFAPNKATYSSITATNATMTGNKTDYTSSVKLTFTKA